MTECERLSERMPEVARGRAAWSRDDASHLAGCPACQAEWDLVRLAATHGLAVAAAVDATRVVEQVAARLQSAPAADPPTRFARIRRAIWPAAVAASLSVGVWLGPRLTTSGGALAGSVAAVLHELDDLTEDELQTLLASVPAPEAEGFRSLDTPDSLGDLTEAELELLLSGMED